MATTMAPEVKCAAASKDAAVDDHPTTSSSSDGDEGNVDAEFQVRISNGEAEGFLEKHNRVSAADKKPETRSGMTLRPRKSESVVKAAFCRQSYLLDFSGDAIKSTAKGNQPRFSISLTKDEIEEDIFLTTGSRTPKQIKSKKQRSKTSRRHLDKLLPGRELHLIAPQRYRVRNNYYY